MAKGSRRSTAIPLSLAAAAVLCAPRGPWGARQQTFAAPASRPPPRDSWGGLRSATAAESADFGSAERWQECSTLLACASVLSATCTFLGRRASSRLQSRRPSPRTIAHSESTGAAVEAVPAWEKGVLPPIWVVNLDRSADRWSQSCEEFAKQDLTAERWPATDGKAMTDEELREKATWFARHFCTPGMVGCFSSHLGIWKEMVKKKIPALIVMEDDVIPYDDFKSRINTLQTELLAMKDPWDVCLLGAIGCINPDKEPFFMRFYELGPGGGRPAPKGSTTRTISPHLFVPHRPAGTHAYMISYEGARKLVERWPKAAYHVDLAAWSVKSLNLVAANPFAATQRFDDGAESTVAKSGSNTERFMRWVLEVAGVFKLARQGGLTNPSWAWRTPLFSVPVPWKRWPNRGVVVASGPFTSMLVLLMTTAVLRRSFMWGGVAFLYMVSMSSFIRYLAGTLDARTFFVEAGASALFFYLGLTRGPTW